MAFFKAESTLIAGLTTHLTTAMAISSDEREFFVALGTRIAELRKTRGVTQTQLARALEVSQQTIQAYEVGRRRIPVSAMPVVARVLGISLEKLFGETGRSAASMRGPAPKLRQQIERISGLPKTKQKFVLKM
jgi:transcriptional regulator with XRE-family HTH domain